MRCAKVTQARAIAASDALLEEETHQMFADPAAMMRLAMDIAAHPGTDDTLVVTRPAPEEEPEELERWSDCD